MRKIYIISVCLLAAAAAYYYIFFFVNRSVFDGLLQQASEKGGDFSQKIINNEDNSISYLRENFCSYRSNSKIIDEVEDIKNINLNGNAESLELSSENYAGKNSINFSLSNQTKGDKAIIERKSLSLDLSRWKKDGIFSAWAKFEKPEDISSVTLILESKNGAKRIYNELQNVNINEENKIRVNDPHPDYSLPEGENQYWQDFQLVYGWNYLFWRGDQYSDSGDFLVNQVVAYQLNFNLRQDYASGKKIHVDNVRVSDGVQKSNNPLGGNWYAPNGMPQYGVFDLSGEQECNLRLINVRREQYPSNGDHARILSNYTTPQNFAFKTRFKIIDPAPGYVNENNSYLRFQYNFDDEYDPGHDWFGAFISFEYKNFGLISVEPVERYTKQRQEPENFPFSARKHFVFDKDKEYQIELVVRSNKAQAHLYQVYSNNKLKKISSVSYDFKRPRSDIGRPFSIETTGSYHMLIKEIEILNLELIEKDIK
ncbi:MAG: hypothetical protein BWY19_00829 [bacterium ADurb.Bin212]|nr:MAG: hypothetical protein BWY19_00829 [bacterium ADurb.Bin212]